MREHRNEMIAVAEGGPVSLIEDRVSGLLCQADAGALARAILDLAASPLLREQLSRGALRAVRQDMGVGSDAFVLRGAAGAEQHEASVLYITLYLERRRSVDLADAAPLAHGAVDVDG